MGPREALKFLEEKGTRWLDLQLTDLFGRFHHITVSKAVVDEAALTEGFGKLDGSSVKGFVGIEESDLVLKPDLRTLAVVPWMPDTARVICQVYRGFGAGRLDRDPRFIAERVEEYLADQGLEARMSAEVEFFIFDEVKVEVGYNGSSYRFSSREMPWSGKAGSYFLRPKEGYYPVPPHDQLASVRQEIADVLTTHFGIVAEVHHHEVATGGQAEINFRYSTPVGTADNVQTLKYVAKNVSAKHGMVAVFMPKPLYGDNGSGMHVHVSIWRGDENLFYDESDDYAEMSQYARYFVGGLLEHARALSAIVSPTTNSYRRLIPGFEAPVYLAWSRANRSAAVRVPVYKRGARKEKRIEYRPPDPSANPYLAMAAIVMAGLDGVRKRTDPGDPVDANIYGLSDADRRKLGIKSLPRNLEEALDELESDHEFLKPVFPEAVVQAYIDMKRKEARAQMQYPSPIEVYYYHDV